MRRAVMVLTVIATLLAGGLLAASPSAADSVWKPAPTKIAKPVIAETVLSTSQELGESFPGTCLRASVLRDAPANFALATMKSKCIVKYGWMVGEDNAAYLFYSAGSGWYIVGRGAGGVSEDGSPRGCSWNGNPLPGDLQAKVEATAVCR